jgi:hypothetical protein
MLQKIKGGLLFVLGPLLLVTSAPALAQRIASGQGTYWGTVIELFILVFTSILFLSSLLILLMGGWFLIKDYVIAKSDHDKSFSLGKLVIALAVASLFGYPSGAYLLGQDLTTGPQTGAEAPSFTRAK